MEKNGFFSRITSFFGFMSDFYFKARNFDELSAKHTTELNRANELHFENIELKQQIEQLNANLFNSHETLTYYSNERNKLFTRVQELEKYLTETQRLTEELEKYQQTLDERNRLIGLLKKSKQNVMKFADYVVREKSLEPVISFLMNSKVPYVLLEPRGKRIIDYNSSFEAELGIEKGVELRNQSYQTIFDGRDNRENLKVGLKKFLDLDEKKEFDLPYERDGKKIMLHITKQKPIAINLDLDYLGKKDREIRVITCVPLVVERASTWQRYHAQSLESVMAKTEEELQLNEEAQKEMANVTSRLVAYRWEESKKSKTSDKIIEIMDKMGESGAYLYFKKVLAELDAAAEAKRKAEETAYKSERKKEARVRLKRLNSNPRRLANIIGRLSAKGLEEKELKAVAQDSKLSYAGVRQRYAEMLMVLKKSHQKNYHKEQSLGYLQGNIAFGKGIQNSEFGNALEIMP